MANRLIRYDTALLRRSLADGFREPLDLMLAAILVTLGLLWLRQQALVLLPQAMWSATLAGPTGFTWQRRLRLRLVALQEHSPLAPAALASRGRRAWLAVMHLLVGLPLLAAAALLGIAAGRPLQAIGLAAAAYATGAALAASLPFFGSRNSSGRGWPSVAPLGCDGRAVLELVLARQGLCTRRPLLRAWLLIVASFILTTMAGWWGEGLSAPLASILPFLPPLVLLLLTTRLDPVLLAFLPAAGYRPGFIALAVSALPAGAFVAGAGAFLLIGHGIGPVAVLALGHLAFILIGIARAWLYPGRTKRSVDLQLQIEVAGLIIVALMLPPLAIVAACWRFRHFHAHCRAQRWTQV